MLTVTCERYPPEPPGRLAKNSHVNAAYTTYAAPDGVAMLEVRPGDTTSDLWRSEDNGRSWALADRVPHSQPRDDGLFTRTELGPLFVDPDHGRIVRFERESLMTEDPMTVQTYPDFVRVFVPMSHRTDYRISADAGLTWGPRRQLIETGPDFDAQHWAQGVTPMQSTSVLGEVPPFLKFADGRIMVPYQGLLDVDPSRYGSIQAGRFWARWQDDLSDLQWRSGSMVPGGGCEQTIVRLEDGRLLNIMRSQGQIEPYPFSPWQRPYTISEDDGDTWSDPQPLQYDDGTGLTSPRAWSQLIRAERDGRLYWIANILPALDSDASEAIRRQWPSRADPRYPLQIVEVDEAGPTLKRDTLTPLIDRAEGETPYVRFSNFFAYNDRQTGDIRVVLKKSYNEHQPDVLTCPEPGYRLSVHL